jgi:hypothetical protein
LNFVSQNQELIKQQNISSTPQDPYMNAWKINHKNQLQIKPISNDRIRRRKSRDQSVNNYRDQKKKKTLLLSMVFYI